MRPGQVDSTTLVRDTVTAALARVLELFLEDHVERVFEEHRLAYVYNDQDTLTPGGNPTQLFVCKCNEALERRKFNAHLKEKLKEVADGQDHLQLRP